MAEPLQGAPCALPGFLGMVQHAAAADGVRPQLIFKTRLADRR